MTVCLVSPFLNNWCLRKKSTNPWAQVIGQEYTSILDMKCSLGHSTLNLLHSPPCFERLLWKLAPETQNQNTLKNPPCRLIFSYSDWKPKQKPSSDFFFFLESTTREDSESPHTGHLVQLSWEICPVFPICTVPMSRLNLFFTKSAKIRLKFPTLYKWRQSKNYSCNPRLYSIINSLKNPRN